MINPDRRSADWPCEICSTAASEAPVDSTESHEAGSRYSESHASCGTPSDCMPAHATHGAGMQEHEQGMRNRWAERLDRSRNEGAKQCTRRRNVIP